MVQPKLGTFLGTAPAWDRPPKMGTVRGKRGCLVTLPYIEFRLSALCQEMQPPHSFRTVTFLTKRALFLFVCECCNSIVFPMSSFCGKEQWKCYFPFKWQRWIDMCFSACLVEWPEVVHSCPDEEQSELEAAAALLGYFQQHLGSCWWTSSQVHSDKKRFSLCVVTLLLKINYLEICKYT